MAAFKKSFLVLAVALLVLAGSTGTANAQFHPSAVITCFAFSVPATARAEGIAEIIGDVIAQCSVPPSVGAPTTPTFIANVGVTLNVNVTNNLFSGTSITDAVMVINEVHTGPTATSTLSSVTNHPNPQYGVLVASNRIEWNGSIMPTPGVAPNPATLLIRITNMRGNVSQLGIPTGEGVFPSAQVTAFLQINSQSAIPVTNNVLNVAVPLLGLRVGRFRGPGGADVSLPIVRLQCFRYNISSTGAITAEDGGTFRVRLTEGFATAFKTLGAPTTNPARAEVEDGYPTPGSGVNNGGATQSTRFIFRFFNVPQGVRVRMELVYHGALIGGHRLTLGRIVGTDSNGAGALNLTLSPSAEVPISGTPGTGFAVYEVFDSNPFAVEEIDVLVTVGWVPNTAGDLPAPGTLQMSVSFAPVSTVTTASTSAPEPRFVDTGVPRSFVTVARCTTQLMWPFVTNQFGFDTGFSIANTTRDPFGTPNAAGPCTLNYFGATTGGGAAPNPQTSAVIAAGSHIVWTLSGGNSAAGITGTPGFQGYIIAVCQFPLAHGFGFITDGFGGVPTIAEGYLALVLDRGLTEPGITVIPEARAH
jgi:hypothetical protein